MATPAPPPLVSLRWCPVCGRDDRCSPFTGKSHWFRGRRCEGQTETVKYGLVRQHPRPAPTTKGSGEEESA